MAARLPAPELLRVVALAGRGVLPRPCGAIVFGLAAVLPAGTDARRAAVVATALALHDRFEWFHARWGERLAALSEEARRALRFDGTVRARPWISPLEPGAAAFAAACSLDLGGATLAVDAPRSRTPVSTVAHVLGPAIAAGCRRVRLRLELRCDPLPGVGPAPLPRVAELRLVDRAVLATVAHVLAFAGVDLLTLEPNSAFAVDEWDWLAPALARVRRVAVRIAAHEAAAYNFLHAVGRDPVAWRPLAVVELPAASAGDERGVFASYFPAGWHDAIGFAGPRVRVERLSFRAPGPTPEVAALARLVLEAPNE